MTAGCPNPRYMYSPGYLSPAVSGYPPCDWYPAAGSLSLTSRRFSAATAPCAAIVAVAMAPLWDPRREPAGCAGSQFPLRLPPWRYGPYGSGRTCRPKYLQSQRLPAHCFPYTIFARKVVLWERLDNSLFAGIYLVFMMIRRLFSPEASCLPRLFFLLLRLPSVPAPKWCQVCLPSPRCRSIGRLPGYTWAVALPSYPEFFRLPGTRNGECQWSSTPAPPSTPSGSCHRVKEGAVTITAPRKQKRELRRPGQGSTQGVRLNAAIAIVGDTFDLSANLLPAYAQGSIAF